MLDVSRVLMILYRPFGSHHTPLAGFVNFLLFRRNKLVSDLPVSTLLEHQALEKLHVLKVWMLAIMIPPPWKEMK